jgi:MHS family alpha-ketoglutarate permease-like MFS transporter
VLGETALAEWAWRVPFFLGAALAVAVFVLRRNIAETESFRVQNPDRRGSTARTLWRDHPREFLLVSAITAGGSLCFYAYTTYLQKFLVNTSGMAKPTATAVMTLALGAFLFMQPAFGALADRFGRKPMLYLFGAGMMLTTVPVFTALSRTSGPVAAFALILFSYLIMACYTSITALIKAELFPADIRTLGVALPYAIGNTLFGGTAEYVALWFKTIGSEAAFYWYIVVIVAVATWAFWMLPETSKTSLIVED